MVTLLGALWAVVRAALKGRRDLVLDNVALQQQLSIYKRTSKHLQAYEQAAQAAAVRARNLSRAI